MKSHTPTILITRPPEQAIPLIEKLQRLECIVLSLPVFTISPPQDNRNLLHTLAHLDQFDFAIFTSPNAVNAALAYWPKHPINLSIAAIGPTTANQLREHHLQIHYQPAAAYSSETLLALPVFQECENKRIVIFTGEDSRPLLSETLLARGAKVTIATCYRRELNKLDIAPIVSAWNSIDVIVITSLTALNYLKQLIEPYVSLREKKFLVSSERIAAEVRAIGSHSLLFAEDATDDSIIRALKKHWPLLPN